MICLMICPIFHVSGVTVAVMSALVAVMEALIPYVHVHTCTYSRETMSVTCFDVVFQWICVFVIALCSSANKLSCFCGYLNC
jgi:hypothetical protein